MPIIRVVSATHRDLDRMVSQELFREDLYYRLSTFPIHLPALRERRDDILLLALALLQRVAPQRKLGISEPAMRLLKAQDYPGNVRELRNLLERASLLCDGATLEAGHVQQALQSGRRPALRADGQPINNSGAARPANTEAEAANHSLQAMEQAALQQVVASHTGSRAELATRLGISERSLYRKIKGLNKP